jgi:hypothetical protein
VSDYTILLAIAEGGAPYGEVPHLGKTCDERAWPHPLKKSNSTEPSLIHKNLKRAAPPVSEKHLKEVYKK